MHDLLKLRSREWLRKSLKNYTFRRRKTAELTGIIILGLEKVETATQRRWKAHKDACRGLFFLLSPGQTIEQSWIQRSNFARSNIVRPAAHVG